MKLSDFKGIFNKHSLEFISAENVKDDYWIIKLKPETGTTWIPGEHAIFTLPGKKIEGKKWRAFSLASIPEEGIIIIGTRTGQRTSSFKNELFKMKPGETVGMRGPFGWYIIRKNSKQHVMIATGVGITPDRALALDIQKDSGKTMELIYSGNQHIFKDELIAIAENSENIKLHLTNNRTETESVISRVTTMYSNNASYYLSGSLKAISSIKKKLKKAGIKSRNVVHDPYLGY